MAVVLAGAALVGACGGSDEAQDSRLPVRLVGTLEGALADDALQELTVVTQDAAAQAWIIGEGEFSPAALAPAAQAFRSGRPVALFNGTRAEIEALAAALGIRPPTPFAPAFYPVDVFAVRGSPSSYKTEVMSYCAGDNMIDSDDEVLSRPPSSCTDSASRQAMRMQLLRRWLEAAA